jgi:hypothetical protein
VAPAALPCPALPCPALPAEEAHREVGELQRGAAQRALVARLNGGRDALAAEPVPAGGDGGGVDAVLRRVVGWWGGRGLGG